MVGGTRASLRTLVVIAVGLTVVIAGGCEADVCADPLSADVPFHYRRSVEPDALARGFGVAEFALMRDPETSTYQFEVPRSASLVTCALLVGSPQISTDPARIANAATIMPRVRGYETRGGEQLALQVGSLRYADANEGAFVCSKRGLTPFMVEGLWLGCWASNGVRITGATELVALELDDVPQSQSAVASCLGASLADTADRLCPLDAEFGVCAESRCVPGTADAVVGPSGQDCDSIGNRLLIPVPRVQERHDRTTVGAHVAMGVDVVQTMGIDGVGVSSGTIQDQGFLSPMLEGGIHVLWRGDEARWFGTGQALELGVSVGVQSWRILSGSHVTDSFGKAHAPEMLMLMLAPSYRTTFAQAWTLGLSPMAGFGSGARRGRENATSDQFVGGAGVSVGYSWFKSMSLEFAPRLVFASVRAVTFDAGGIAESRAHQPAWVLQFPVVVRIDDITSD
jgi:hypothetical protein